MSDPPRYSLDDDLEEAEAAARELPGQIARLKGMVEVARAVLKPDDDPPAGREQPGA